MHTLKEYAQKVADLHFEVATSGNADIAHYRSIPYMTTENALKHAIMVAYPELTKSDIENVMHIFADCNESIAYCIDVHKRDKEADRYTELEVYRDSLSMDD